MSGFQIILFLISVYFFWELYKLIIGKDFEKMAKERLTNSKIQQQNLLDKAQKALEYKDFDGAIEYLQKLLEQNPKDVYDIYLKLGLAYEGKNMLEIALKQYLKAIKFNPNDDRGHLAAASLYRKLQRAHEAQNHYKKALLIDPYYPLTYYNYGNLLLDMGQKEEAKKMYQKAIEIDNSFEAAKEALKELEKDD